MKKNNLGICLDEIDLRYYNPCPEWDREEINSSFRLIEAGRN
jgi:hypothetical protein